MPDMSTSDIWPHVIKLFTVAKTARVLFPGRSLEQSLAQFRCSTLGQALVKEY
jgi:hypothetical protein